MSCGRRVVSFIMADESILRIVVSVSVSYVTLSDSPLEQLPSTNPVNSIINMVLITIPS